MDDAARTRVLAQVRAHCARPPHAVLFDETGETLFDVASAKTLPLRRSQLTGCESRQDRTTGAPYLHLRYEDGRELALTDTGIAFSPSTLSTGPLPELPAAVCWRDLTTLLSQVQHQLRDHPDDAPGPQAVSLVMMCLAIVEGGRVAGFSVDAEERAVETELNLLESRAGPG